MGKKKKNVTKKGTSTIIVIAIVLSIVIFGLKLTSSGLLNNSKLFRSLVASITGKSSYTIDEKKEAVLRTADAYLDRGMSLQYDTFKKSYLTDPEEITTDDVSYTDGGAFVYSVYKKSLGIDLPATSTALVDYGANYSDTDFVPLYFNNSTTGSSGVIVDTENGEYQSKTDLLASFRENIQKGDIIAFKTLGSDNRISSHAVIVHDNTNVSLRVIHARGISYHKDYTIYKYDEEYNMVISQEEEGQTVYNNYVGYVEGTGYSPYNAVGYDEMYDLLDSFAPENTLEIAVIRPLGLIGDQFMVSKDGSNNENNQGIELTDSAKARLEYDKIKITKTSDKHDNTTVSQDDEITYTITIDNPSDSAYSNLDVLEKISSAGTVTNAGGGNLTVDIINDPDDPNKEFEDGFSSIEWNNINVPAHDTYTITYKVRPKKGSRYVDSKIISIGNVDGISTGEIELKILYTLNDTQRNTFSSATSSNTDAAYVNDLYSSIGIDLGLTNDMTAERVFNESNKFHDMIPDDMYKSSLSDVISRELIYNGSSYDFAGYDEAGGKRLPYDALGKNLITGDIILITEYINGEKFDAIYVVKNDGIYYAGYPSSPEYPGDDIWIENFYAKNYLVVLRPSILSPSYVEIKARTTNVALDGHLTLGIDKYRTDSSLLDTITWSSSDTSKITVDSTGKLTGVALGTATITATAANGVSDSKEFTVKNSVDSNTNLESLSLKTISFDDEGYHENAVTLSPAFDTGTTSYTATITEAADDTYNLYYVPTPESESSVVEVTSNVTNRHISDDSIYLYPGENVITFKVIAEDESYQDYVVTINREYTDSSYLSTLWVVGGDLDQDFSPGQPTYSTTIVAEDLANYDVNIVAYPQLWEGATVNIIRPASLQYGNNVFKIRVQGIELPPFEYTLNVNIETPDYNDNTLSSISYQINGGTETLIDGFDPSINDYVIEIPNNVTELVLRYAVTTVRATVGQITTEPENPSFSDRYVIHTIPVIAADGKTNIYTVTVIREGNNESRLQSLSIKDSDENELDLVPEFNPDTYGYTVYVDNDIDTVDITATPINPYARMQIQAPDELIVGENTVKIAVYGEDASSECEEGDISCVNEGASVYEITIVREASSYNKLTNLYIQDHDINPNFDPDITGYTASVDNSVDSIYIVAENDSDHFVRIEGDGSHELEVGPNEINITVTADNEDSNIYTITVTRQGDETYDGVEIDGSYAILSDEIKVSELEHLVESGNGIVLDKNKTEKAANSKVATGDYLRIGSFDYNIVILGDFNEDGYVDDADVYGIYIYTYNELFDIPNPEVSESQLKAGDFNKDTVFDDRDVYDLYIYTYNKIFGGE